MYDDVSTLLNEIAAGEDALLGFKEVVFKGDQVRFARVRGKAQTVIAEVLVSMANMEGGVVLFGVNDDREIVGIDESKRDLLEQFVVNLGLHNCRPPIDPILDWLKLPDQSNQLQLCLKVTISKSRFYVHQTTDGRFLKRVGSHRTPIPAEQLGRLLAARNLLIPFEERPALGASTDAVDLNRFLAYYQQRFGQTPDERGIPVHQLLRNLKLATEDEVMQLHPSNLGILLFTERPDTWLNDAFIDVAAYTHDIADGNTADARKVFGPVPEQIEKILHYLSSSPLIATVSTKDGLGRQEEPTYALTALQEATVNALAHRDYELQGSQVRILIFPDRIEFWNPGGLPNTISPDDLYAGCQPVRRNQQLAGFLRDYVSPVTHRSYMEARGEGFLNLVRESEQVSGRRPELRVQKYAVCLTIFAGRNK